MFNSGPCQTIRLLRPRQVTMPSNQLTNKPASPALLAWQENRLGRRLLLGVLLISGLMACLISALQLYSEYRRDLDGIDTRLAEVGESYAKPLVAAAWNYDWPFIKLQLEGITKLPDISYATLLLNDSEQISHGAEPPMDASIITRYPLVFLNDGVETPVGELVVIATLEHARTRLWERLGIELLTQVIKTLVVSALLLLFFHYIVTRRLRLLAHQAQHLTVDNLPTPITLPPPPFFKRSEDELDSLVNKLNQMRMALQQGLKEKQVVLEALQASEERFKLAMQGASDGLWDWNLVTGYVYFSPHWGEMLGYGVHEILPNVDTWRQLLHEDDLPSAKQAVEHYLQGHLSEYRQRFRMRHKNGQYRWILSRGFALRNDKGIPYRFIGTHADITNTLQAESTIWKLSSAIEQSPVAVAIVDRQGCIEYFNNKFFDVVGNHHVDLLGLPLVQLIDSSELRRNRSHPLVKAVTQREGWNGELAIDSEPMQIRWQAVTVSPIVAAEADASGMLVLLEDITTRRQYEDQLQYQAHYDTLTHLPNRTLATDRLKQALAQAKRKAEKVAILFFDLDRFKLINDSMGHGAGDSLLVMVADRLKQCLREGETVARFGGDEFLFILPGIQTVKQAEPVIRRIMQVVAHPFELGHETIYVTISMGVSLFPDDGLDPESLIQNADAAMYQSKHAGRNTSSFFISALNDEAQQRLQLETHLRSAISKQELSVVYQPVVDIRSGEVVGVEALTRWHNPILGQIVPDIFIALAEETGLIRQLDEWLLENITEQLRDWRDRNVFHGYVAVNASPKEVRGEHYKKRLHDLLTEHSLPASAVEVEVTERSVLDANVETHQQLMDIDGMGVGLSIDDFGTGYSALSYLHSFPFKIVKIDKSFMRNLSDKGQNAALVRGIIRMVHSLGMRVVAEGIETEADWHFLKRVRCDLGQGYYFARPMPAEAFEQKLLSGELVAASAEISAQE